MKIDWIQIGKDIWLAIKIFGLFYLIFYCVPYTIRKAWGDAENRTKKVCDTCYRDINKWNEALKKAKLVK